MIINKPRHPLVYIFGLVTMNRIKEVIIPTIESSMTLLKTIAKTKDVGDNTTI